MYPPRLVRLILSPPPVSNIDLLLSSLLPMMLPSPTPNAFPPLVPRVESPAVDPRAVPPMYHHFNANPSNCRYEQSKAHKIEKARESLYPASFPYIEENTTTANDIINAISLTRDSVFSISLIPTPTVLYGTTSPGMTALVLDNTAKFSTVDVDTTSTINKIILHSIKK